MPPYPLSQHAPPGERPSSFEHGNLVASMAAGDPDALGALYDHYADRAFAVAWSILGTTAPAEDALIAGTRDFWRRCTSLRPVVASGDWLLCRVSAHALDRRRLGLGVSGRLSALTDAQTQILALATAGGMSRSAIATEMQISPAGTARAMNEALVLLRASPAGGHRTAGGPETSAQRPAEARSACRARPLDERAL